MTTNVLLELRDWLVEPKVTLVVMEATGVTVGKLSECDGLPWPAARTKDKTYLGARYQRLAPRLGKKKAIVAVEHSSNSRPSSSHRGAGYPRLA